MYSFDDGGLFSDDETVRPTDRVHHAGVSLIDRPQS